MNIRIGSESKQLLDGIRELFVSTREVKGQVWIQQSEFKTLCGQFSKSLTFLLQADGRLPIEDPLRSATIALIRSLDALEKEVEDGLPIWGRVMVPQEKCLELITQIAIDLRHAERYALGE